MSVAEIVSIAGVVIVGIGIIYTIRRNDKKRAERDGSFKTELSLGIENLEKRLDHPDYGLGALSKQINSMKQHCATVSTSLAEKIKGAESDIVELKAKKRKAT